jgi:hypothetical protein
MIARFHPDLDEIYFLPDGWIHGTTYDLMAATYAEQRLGPTEIAPSLRAGLIPRGQTCTISC